MANFQYIALDAKGDQTTGTVQAGSEADAVAQLRTQGLYPTQVIQEGKGKLTSGAKGKGGAKGKATRPQKGGSAAAKPRPTSRTGGSDGMNRPSKNKKKKR